MGCGCGGGGGARPVQVPQVQNNVANHAAQLHPAAQAVHNIQKLAEERRKIERLRREQLIKAMTKP